MKNKIEIEVFKISPDGKFLETIFNVPGTHYGYYLSSFKLEVRDGNGNSEYFDLSESLGLSSDNHQAHWVIRIPLRDLGIDYPAIYIATFKANIEKDDLDCDYEIIDSAVCSDVNGVYQCLLDDVLKECESCANGANISDDVIRNYLLLYGHYAAMDRRDFDVAERYFKIVSRCSKPCGNQRNSKCGCDKKKHNVKHDCGCKQ